MNSWLPSSREAVRSWVVRIALGLAGALCAVMLVVTFAMGVAKPLPSVVTFLALPTTMVLLYVVAVRPAWTRAVAAVFLLLSMGVLVAVEVLVPPGGPMGPVTALIVIPTLAALLVGPRFAIASWAFTPIALWVSLEHTGYPEGRLIGAVAIVIIGGVVAMLAAVTELQRSQAEHESDDRQRALEEAARKAVAAAEAKGTFIATMSHEIRTPMNAVLGLTRVLLDSDLDADQRDLAATVLDAGESLLRVLNDVLDLSRLDAGEVEIESVPMELRRVCRDVEHLLARDASDRGVDLSFEVEPQVPDWVLGDSTRLRQILMNLVGNALKFTREGDVRVTIARVEAGMRIQVRDTGIGIAPERRETLFDPFTQADASTTRRFGGSGLGLAICKDLVEAMGGTIGVTSTVGIGSTFTVVLDLPRASPPTINTEILPDPRRGARVLVVDDNPVNVLVARRSLEALGMEVSSVSDGKAAVEAIQEADFDLVLMDCFMPVMDGFEATRRIRAAGLTKETLPIVALTASVTAEDQERVLAAGMDDVLAKPLEPARFRRVLLRYLGTDETRRLAG